VLKSAKKPLIILGKGAAYAQADEAIKTLRRKVRHSVPADVMAKGLLPDTHPQCAGAARSLVLKDSDVVMHDRRAPELAALARQGQDLGRRAEEVHPDRHRAARDGQQRRDRGARRRRHRFVRHGPARGDGFQLPQAAGRLAATVAKKRDENVAKMAPKLMNNNVPMDYHGALGVC
jgi:oxalyl-CoA decarboxylase